MSEEAKAAFENMRFYKFYPIQSPNAPDVSNVKVGVWAFLHGAFGGFFMEHLRFIMNVTDERLAV